MYATILPNRRPGETTDITKYNIRFKNKDLWRKEVYFTVVEVIHQMLNDHKMFLQLKLKEN